MKNQKYIFIILVAIAGMIACAKVPITNRKQMKLLPESTLQSMSSTEYRKIIAEGPLSTNAAELNRVKTVGTKVAQAIESYLRANNGQSRLEGVSWEFNLINKNEANAWCMPGGKVAVYSGLLALTKDDNGMATVLGHEIAHAIARHGNERMSQQLLLKTGEATVAVAVANKPAETQKVFRSAYGLGTELGFALPYSRLHETEADKMGLIFMAMAGYDPRTSIEFWKRMSSMGGDKPPAILSTHPSDEVRIKNLQAALPEALKYYKVK